MRTRETPATVRPGLLLLSASARAAVRRDFDNRSETRHQHRSDAVGECPIGIQRLHRRGGTVPPPG